MQIFLILSLYVVDRKKVARFYNLKVEKNYFCIFSVFWTPVLGEKAKFGFHFGVNDCPHPFS
jgi:hypothetical protein